MTDQTVTNDHPDDIAVDRFADAMKIKMAAARAKGRSGWDDPKQCSVDVLQDMLVHHLAKGDPIDIGNFAMMLWNRGEVTVSADSVYRRKLGEFANEAFMAQQRANKLAAEWGLAQIQIAELRAELNASMPPSGFVLVPTSMTPEMRRAWDHAPQGDDDDVNMAVGYSAMLNAAPAPSKFDNQFVWNEGDDEHS